MTPSLQLAGGLETVGVFNLLGTRHLLIDLEPAIQRPPYAAQLRYGSEDRSLYLIDEVVVLVGTLDEVRVVGVDCQLRLADKGVLESKVHEDIVGTLFQPVLYTDYLELLGRFLTQFGKVLE